MANASAASSRKSNSCMKRVAGRAGVSGLFYRAREIESGSAWGHTSLQIPSGAFWVDVKQSPPLVAMAVGMAWVLCGAERCTVDGQRKEIKTHALPPVSECLGATWRNPEKIA